jgi:ribosomal protein S3AE
VKKFYAFAAALVFGSASLLAVSAARADETVKEKVENTAGDMKTDAHKSHRAAKRHARKAAGTDNVAKDAKDKANDVGDDISNGADKAKRKTE